MSGKKPARRPSSTPRTPSTRNCPRSLTCLGRSSERKALTVGLPGLSIIMEGRKRKRGHSPEESSRDGETKWIGGAALRVGLCRLGRGLLSGYPRFLFLGGGGHLERLGHLLGLLSFLGSGQLLHRCALFGYLRFIGSGQLQHFGHLFGGLDSLV